jgi:hypothetical protein
MTRAAYALLTALEVLSTTAWTAAATVDRTVLVGPMVRPGAYGERTDHYRLLRTLADVYGLAPVGHSATATPLAHIWK